MSVCLSNAALRQELVWYKVKAHSNSKAHTIYIYSIYIYTIYILYIYIYIYYIYYIYLIGHISTGWFLRRKMSQDDNLARCLFSSSNIPPLFSMKSIGQELVTREKVTLRFYAGEIVHFCHIISKCNGSVK